MLKTFHVMPLLPGHEAELAADAELLLEKGVCTDIACIMTLVPEGDPPENKAKILGRHFYAFRDAFRGDPAKLGILAQATIGHGYVPDEPSSFQKIIRPDGGEVYQMCPLEPAFQSYIREAFTTLASLRPAFLMIDDDFRLLTGRGGCFCPLHLAEAERVMARSLTRETLINALRNNRSLAKQYDALLLDSLMQLAGVIRDAVDEVDTSIPGSFCTCYGDIRHADPISRRLAGKDHPRVVRINNARYLSPEMRSFPVRMYHGAAQAAALADDITVLAETDTCPQNRYSTGARLMHSHYTGSILEGCRGAKHWITRTSAYQPRSGEAYRDILIRYNRFYEALSIAVRESAPAGYAAAALPGDPFFNAAPDRGDRGGSERTWGALIGVLGLPCNYEKMPDLPVMLTGEDVELFSDGELLKFFKTGLILEGPAAEKLCMRGFSSEIGVNAESWGGPRVSAEKWNRTLLRPDVRYTKLTPADPKTMIHSVLLHRSSGVSERSEEIGPAVTLFENGMGGRIAVFSARFGPSSALSSFGFYDEDRKRELLDLLGYVCGAPVAFYYPGDAEVYMKMRRYADGRYLLCFFNLGHDPLDALPLESAYGITGVEMLTPDGRWEKVAYSGGCLQTPLLPAEPKVFRITT